LRSSLAHAYTLTVQVQGSESIQVNTGSQNKPTPLITSGAQTYSLTFDNKSVEKNNLQFSLKKNGNTIYCSGDTEKYGPYIPFEDENNKTLKSLTLALSSSSSSSSYACTIKNLEYK